MTALLVASGAAASARPIAGGEVTIDETRVTTAAGAIAVIDRKADGRPIIFLHGNSFSSRIFAPQLMSPILRSHRLVFIDLLGHGQSDDARDPQQDYSIIGLAATVDQVLSRLRVPSAILVGWSLGGQVVLELVARYRNNDDIFLLGACPMANPVNLDDFPYQYPASFEQLGPEPWSQMDLSTFVRGCLSPEQQPSDFMLRDATRADPRMRARTSEAAIQGLISDQVAFVRGHERPIAVAAGERDAFVRFDYLDRIQWKNRWRGRTLLLPEAGHAASWEAPLALETLIAEFAAI